MVTRRRTAAVADATALATAVGGTTGGEQVAEANGMGLDGADRVGSTVQVVVRNGSHEAAVAAEAMVRRN
jgi:hypothetical protein